MNQNQRSFHLIFISTILVITGLVACRQTSQLEPPPIPSTPSMVTESTTFPSPVLPSPTSISTPTVQPSPTPTQAVLDLSFTFEPIAQWGNDGINDVVVADGVAYLTVETKLIVLDVSTPTDPTQISEVLLPGMANQLYLIDNTLYVVIERGTLLVYDVSAPTNPTRYGMLELSGNTKIVGHSDSPPRLYQSGGRVIDVSNPLEPTVVTTIQFVTEVSIRTVATKPNGSIYAYTSESGYCYTSRGDGFCSGSFIRVYEITNPAKPVQLGFLETETWSQEIVVDGVRIYSVEYFCSPFEGCTSGSGLRSIDLSDPTNPQTLDFYTEPYFNPSGFVFSNNLLFASGMQIWDVANPVRMVKARSVIKDDDFWRGDVAAIIGDYIYLFHRNKLQIVEFQTSQPTPDSLTK